MSIMKDVELGKRWVAALRSGEYKRGTGALRRDDRFCCLGVLCDIQKEELGGEWAHRVHSCAFDFQGSRGRVYSSQAIRVPNGPKSEVAHALAMLNDAGKSFDYIADYIEERL